MPAPPRENQAFGSGWKVRVFKHVTTIFLTILLGGLLGATLVRFAPGFGVDANDLDPSYSAETREALRQTRAVDGSIVGFYFRYLAGLLRGELGTSHSLNRPVAELLAERAPITLRLVGLGLLGGWTLGLGFALVGSLLRSTSWNALAALVSAALLSIPSAVIALAFLFAGGPGSLAVACIIFPKVFRYTRNLLVEAEAMPHVLAGWARGLGRARIVFRHMLPTAAPQMLALAGVSVSIAIGVAIPIEVVCDYPGIGHLAWNAAMGRDLPLMVNLTLLVTVITLFANSAADFAIAAAHPSRERKRAVPR